MRFKKAVKQLFNTNHARKRFRYNPFPFAFELLNTSTHLSQKPERRLLLEDLINSKSAPRLVDVWELDPLPSQTGGEMSTNIGPYFFNHIDMAK